MDNILNIRDAKKEDLYDLAILFDFYRVFYKQESNLRGSKIFLEERMKNKESIIYVATYNGRMVGFTQLYPIFSSSTMEKMYVLNDLFVHPDYRNKSIGYSLLRHAQNFALENKFKGLVLATEKDNFAQKLYEKMGWVKDEVFFHYFWSCKEEKEDK